MNKVIQLDEDMALPFCEVDEGGIGQATHSRNNHQKSHHDKMNSMDHKGTQNSFQNKQGKNTRALHQIMKSMPGKSLPRIGFSENSSALNQTSQISSNQHIQQLSPPQYQNPIHFGQLRQSTVYVPGFLKYLNKANGSFSIGSMQPYPNKNFQLTSSQFQKDIFKTIVGSPSQNLTITQRVENLPPAAGYFQVQVSTPGKEKQHLNGKHSTTSLLSLETIGQQASMTQIKKQSAKEKKEEQFGEKHIEENKNAHEGTDISVKSIVKEASHELQKMISPNAYKSLKMKSLKSSSNHGVSLFHSTSQILTPSKQKILSIPAFNQNQEDNISSPMLLQSLGEGDKFSHDGLRGVTSLNDFFKNQRIVSQEQSQLSQIKEQNSSKKQYKNQRGHMNAQMQDTCLSPQDSSFSLKLDKYKFKSMNATSIPESHLIEGVESALLSQDKVNIIKEMNDKKGKDNFYASFIQKCLEQSQFDTLMLSSPIKKKKKEIFETDLDKIKVSSLLLDIIDKEAFVMTDKSQDFEMMSHMPSSNIIKTNFKRPTLNQKQKDKLFQVLADTDKIVVHTSQNKDLMAPSERRDVVRLAQWLEDIIQKTYQMKDLDFFEYFENMQLICSACMSELIRQIGVTVQERGQLVKRVWESMLNLMKQAFEQVTLEKKENEKLLNEEIKQNQKNYLKKIDEYLPQIETLKKQLEISEAKNKRVVLEFRYLKKKDAKLEKYLKLSKKDLRAVEEEYQKLDKDYQNFKNTYDSQEQLYNQKIAQMRKYINAGLVKKENDDPDDEEISVSKLYSDQGGHYKQYRQTASKVKKGFKEFSKNIEQYATEVKDMQEEYTSDVKTFQKDYKEIDDIEQIEDTLYSKKGDIDALLQMDDRIIEEIGGNDGITLVIGHCSTQTGPDLIKMVHQQVDTSQLIQQKERAVQTIETQIDVKEVQTPDEWMQLEPKQEEDHSDQIIVEEFKKRQNKQSRFSTLKVGASLHEIDDEIEVEQKREEMEQQEQAKLLRLTQLQYLNEDQEDQERKKLFELVREYYEESPSQDRKSIVLEWKNQQDSQFKSLIQLEPVETKNKLGDLESIQDSASESEDDENFNQPLKLKQKSPKVNILHSKQPKLRESITTTLKNQVERDLEDLNMLIMSRTSHATILFEKILNNNLLKDNTEVQPVMISKFIEDSKKIINEEHTKLKKIWDRTNVNMLDYVKQKIMIAEKDAELQEVKDNKMIIEHQIQQFQKEIFSNEDKKTEVTSLAEYTTQKKLSSTNSIADTDEEVNYIDKDDSDEAEIDDLDSSLGSCFKDVSASKIETSAILKKEDISSSKKKENILPKGLTSQKIIKSQGGTSNAIPNASQNKGVSTIQGNPKKGKKNTTQNPFNRVSVSLVEAVMQQQKQQQSQKSSFNQNQEAKQFQEFQKMGQFSKILPQSQKMIGMGSNGQVNLSSTLSIGAAIWLKGIPLMNWKNPDAVSSSPNVESASQFFNGTAMQLMKKDLQNNQNKDGKIVVMKQQNVLKHIINIYYEKIKSSKTEEEGSTKTLNLVAYDYFLNQFGFKKLAETKLKQFLKSCIYYCVSFKIRTFTKLYGINKIMNYDFEDFDFFAKMLAFIEEGNTPQLVAAGLSSINRVTEALFKNFEDKIPPSELLRLKQELDNMKVSDSTSKSKTKSVVDIDHALDILLQACIEEKKVFIQNILNLFLAVKYYTDQVISLEEFLMLLRHMESSSFNYITATKFYYVHCDMVDKVNSQRIMSFPKFALNCIHSNMLSLSSQEKYAVNVEHFDKIKNIENLEKYWEDKKDIIKLRLVKNGNYTLLYRQMIKKIDSYFQSPKENRKSTDKTSTWFTYRLLDDESKRLMIESIISVLVPEQLLSITKGTQQLLKKVCSSVA